MSPYVIVTSVFDHRYALCSSLRGDSPFDSNCNVFRVSNAPAEVECFEAS